MCIHWAKFILRIAAPISKTWDSLYPLLMEEFTLVSEHIDSFFLAASCLFELPCCFQRETQHPHFNCVLLVVTCSLIRPACFWSTYLISCWSFLKWTDCICFHKFVHFKQINHRTFHSHHTNLPCFVNLAPSVFT